MRVAVIDCGTNTVRLLIADGDGADLVDVVRELKFVRLGQDVDANRRFHPDALRRCFAVLDQYALTIATASVEKVRFVATSAVRDVSNREEFFDGVRRRLGIDPEVIDGAQEAELSFLGALSGGPVKSGAAAVLVMDIGGGSTELVLGTPKGQIDHMASLDIGSVRIRERFLTHDPPTTREVETARQFVAALIDQSGLLRDRVDRWIGVGGTSTSLSAINLGLGTYDPSLVHNSAIDVAGIESLSRRLLDLSVADTIRAYPTLQPMRAEVICAGGLIAAEVAVRADCEMLVRETDILDGAALRLMTEENNPDDL